MSHFVAVVVGENPDYELAPFHEFECTGVDDEFVVDVEITAKVQKQIEESKLSLHEALEWFGLDNLVLSSETEAVRGENGPHKYGYAVVTADGQLVKAIDRTNPNKKWDWWEIGGRWSRRILRKDGVKCDSARKGDIDFDTMRSDAESKAFKDWNTVHTVIDQHPPIVPWAAVRDDQFPGDIDKARTFYNSQSGVAVFSAWSKANDYPFGIPYEVLDSFLIPRADYVKRAGENSFVHFAFVKDRKWHERGRMGWFATVSGEKDPETWAATFRNFITSLDDNETLTIVDCHI